MGVACCVAFILCSGWLHVPWSGGRTCFVFVANHRFWTPVATIIIEVTLGKLGWVVISCAIWLVYSCQPWGLRLVLASSVCVRPSVPFPSLQVSSDLRAPHVHRCPAVPLSPGHSSAAVERGGQSCPSRGIHIGGRAWNSCRAVQRTAEVSPLWRLWLGGPLKSNFLVTFNLISFTYFYYRQNLARA